MSHDDDLAKTLPTHLGIILDGNRRWAKAHNLPHLEGHRRGYENLKKIGQAALDSGVKYFSAYIFSTENWERESAEVEYLISQLFWLAIREIDDLHKKDVRVQFAGSSRGLDQKAIDAMAAVEAKTADNKRGTFVLCFNYGGQQEIADAVVAIVESKVAAAEVTPELIASHLYVPNVPNVDLIIRTSGEERLSNFMLWRAAYSEIMFVDEMWPDFDEAKLHECLAQYATRQRRFGK